MGPFAIYIFTLIFLFLFEFFFFGIAKKYNIIDKPNHRSSHNAGIIRGGGIIFSVSCILWFGQSNLTYPLFIGGLILIASISFLDDIITLKSGIRLLVQIAAIALLIIELNMNVEWYWLPVIIIVIAGTINVYNFMDGINGITGGYSTATLLTLIYVNHSVHRFTSESLLVFILLSLIVFNFFNFRAVAKCFAGDVGSVSMAFIICFLLLKLIHSSDNFIYVAFLLVYGLDGVSTIICRLVRRENILEAHRSHFYQYLVNEKKWRHISVSILYVFAQLLINFLILTVNRVKDFVDYNILILIVLTTVAFIAFIALRFMVEGKRLLNP